MFIRERPGGRRIRPRSLRSLGCVLVVIGFIRGRWVHRSSPLCSSGSYRADGFIGVRPGACQFHAGSLVVGLTAVTGNICVRPEGLVLILGRWVYWGAPTGSLGSSGVTGFIGVHPWSCRVCAGSLGSWGCALGVVGFIRGRRVHWNAPCWSSGSSAVAGFIGVHLGDCRVHPGSLDSLGCALGVVGFIRGFGVHWGAHWCVPVHPVSLGSLGFALGVVGFIRGRRVHWGARRVHLRLRSSLGFTIEVAARFIGERPGGRPVRPGSLGCAIVIVGFIWGYWVHCGVPKGSLSVVGFIGVALSVVGFTAAAELI